MGRRTLLLIASILVAAVGTALIGLYVRGADTRAQGDVRPVTVLVAADDIPADTPASAIQPRAEQRTRGELPADAIGNSRQITGTSTTRILAGQVLQRRMFSTDGTGAGTGAPSGGTEWLSVELSDAQRANGLIRVGSWVFVYKMHDKKSEKVMENSVQIIQLGASTLNTSTSTSRTTRTAVPGSLVGLKLNADQVQLIKDAEADGGLFLTVAPNRSENDG